MTSLLVLLAVGLPLLAVLSLGYQQENEPAVSNTVVAVLLTATPAVVERTLGAGQLSFTPLLTTWIGVASLLHCLGMLGYYESIDWWDHLTHALSAALAAALIYAALLVAFEPLLGGIRTLAAATLAAILVLSLLWEVAELFMRELGRRYGVEPVLVHYGWRDTGLDLVYDLLGAVLVLALDLRLFVPVFETLAAAV